MNNNGEGIIYVYERKFDGVIELKNLLVIIIKYQNVCWYQYITKILLELSLVLS